MSQYPDVDSNFSRQGYGTQHSYRNHNANPASADRTIAPSQNSTIPTYPPSFHQVSSQPQSFASSGLSPNTTHFTHAPANFQPDDCLPPAGVYPASLNPLPIQRGGFGDNTGYQLNPVGHSIREDQISGAQIGYDPQADFHHASHNSLPLGYPAIPLDGRHVFSSFGCQTLEDQDSRTEHCDFPKSIALSPEQTKTLDEVIDNWELSLNYPISSSKPGVHSLDTQPKSIHGAAFFPQQTPLRSHEDPRRAPTSQGRHHSVADDVSTEVSSCQAGPQFVPGSTQGRTSPLQARAVSSRDKSLPSLAPGSSKDSSVHSVDMTALMPNANAQWNAFPPDGILARTQSNIKALISARACGKLQPWYISNPVEIRSFLLGEEEWLKVNALLAKSLDPVVTWTDLETWRGDPTKIRFKPATGRQRKGNPDCICLLVASCLWWDEKVQDNQICKNPYGRTKCHRAGNSIPKNAFSMQRISSPSAESGRCVCCRQRKALQTRIYRQNKLKKSEGSGGFDNDGSSDDGSE